MKSLFLKYTFVLFTVTTLFTACKKDPETEAITMGQVNLEFEHVVGNEELALNPQQYTNANGDQFQITTFKYYISNIVLIKADGSTYKQPDSYYLIDQEKPDSKLLTLNNVPSGEYTGLTFTVGVDSVRNVSGAQTGALDPAQGMFWSWNTGYIFLKLEGYSPQSEKGGLTFHIGGFKAPNNTIRTVSPDLNGNKMLVAAGKAPQVHLKVNVLEMFQSPRLIKFADLSTTMGGPASVTVADNYRDMFRVDHIHN
ncbi:MbnP family protein [Adhaeribacter pallidiroseus]|uniref:Copper-binding protein MbnP-like domain-containing protein n=1 Tax=Adhaeribacter pallidiroseus TaxID=2072847 RepID=A0A369QI13_9BACT|nr:MbnP family protein [Adhaeribacter pallidiroseus]RDC63940.1 hypothetical protein AHMF7616_02549 [Adhaeribacter pallidiroseus]